MEAEKRRVRAGKRFGRADFPRMRGGALTGSALAMRGTNQTGAEQSAAARDLVLAAPAVRRWVERALGGIVIAFAARLALSDR